MSSSPTSESRFLAVHVPIAEAMRRHAIVALLPVVLLAGLGVAYGLQRSPTYTATAENVVRALSPSAGQLPGAIQAAQELAASESRLIDSDGIAAPLARRLDTTTDYVVGHVSATPVPSSTVIRIEAEGPTADDAITLANEAARLFADYVNEQTERGAEGDTILADYRAASAAYQRELAVKQGIDRAGSAASPNERLRAIAALEAAKLRRDALSSQYQTVIQSEGSAPTVKTFVVARDAASDRLPTAQLYGLAGAVVGLVVGAALATLLANRRARTLAR